MNFKQNETFEPPDTGLLKETGGTNTSQTESQAEKDAEDQIGDEDEKEPSKCEKMFLIQTKLPDIDKARNNGSNQNVGGQEQEAAAGTFEVQANQVAKMGNISDNALS